MELTSLENVKMDNQLLDLHQELRKNFPNLYQDWSRRFPFDQECVELTKIFRISNENNLQDFCQRFWHLVTQKPHLKKENINDVQNFHIHFYEDSTFRLRGPHPLDMSGKNESLINLANDLEELVSKATSEKPILIHTDSGDDLYDHTYGAFWLGRILPLDFSKLD